jgi:hypothetical protein
MKRGPAEYGVLSMLEEGFEKTSRDQQPSTAGTPLSSLAINGNNSEPRRLVRDSFAIDGPFPRVSLSAGFTIMPEPGRTYRLNGGFKTGTVLAAD